MTTDTLAKLAAPADFVTRLLAVVQIYQQQDDAGAADAAELYRAVCRVVGAAQALPAAPEPKFDVAYMTRLVEETQHMTSLGTIEYSMTPIRLAYVVGMLLKAAQQAAQAPAVPDAAMLQQAYRRGFLRCTAWAGRDDLEHDVGSPAYLKDQANDLMQLANVLHQPPQPQEDAA